MADPLEQAMAAVNQQYPTIGQHKIGVSKGMGEYYSEFYPPWETGTTAAPHPFPGTPHIQVMSKGSALEGQDLQNLLAGESLHHLGSINPIDNIAVDPTWQMMKQSFAKSAPPHQIQADRQAYLDEVKQGETRPFDQWYAQSRGDVWLRHGLFPLASEATDTTNWFSAEQRSWLTHMKSYLQKGHD